MNANLKRYEKIKSFLATLPADYDNLQKATAIGESPEMVKLLLADAKSMLNNAGQAQMRGATYDAPNKRLVAADGSMWLQWQLRSKPEEPVSYFNQQTNSGGVYIFFANE